VLIVSGIWPPDVGGPASHAPEVAGFLTECGHHVEVVTTAASAPASRPYRVVWASRRLPMGARHLQAAALVARRAASADVVYTTGMLGRTAAGALVARRPFVVKLTADPAYERARRRGIVVGGLEEFQSGGGGLTGTVLRAARNAELRRAALIVCPSDYLRRLALGWGVSADRIEVLPNAAPARSLIVEPNVPRAPLGVDGRPLLVVAGRLTRQKNVEAAIEAAARIESVSLLVVGDGDERARLEQLAVRLGLGERISFLGAQPRERVLELLSAADLCLLPSVWENSPHTVIESLALGTPVIASNVGGVAEIVRDGENGLLVAPGDVEALEGAVRRFFADPPLATRLQAAAAPSVAGYAPERILQKLEALLSAAAGPRVAALSVDSAA
jgi:glycosyltransferase involved in cell wall biosynthesis